MADNTSEGRKYVYLVTGAEQILLGQAAKFNIINNPNEGIVAAWSLDANAGNGEAGIKFSSWENVIYIGVGSPHTILFLDKPLEE